MIAIRSSIRHLVFGAPVHTGLLHFQPDDVAAAGPSRLDARTPLPLLQRVRDWFAAQDARRREHYLAQAQDVCDLEQRIRELEEPRRWNI
jgi:hypothetical protein